MKRHSHTALHHLILLFAPLTLAPLNTYAGQSSVRPTTGSGAHRTSCLGWAFNVRVTPIIAGKWDGAVRLLREMSEGVRVGKVSSRKVIHEVRRAGTESLPAARSLKRSGELIKAVNDITKIYKYSSHRIQDQGIPPSQNASQTSLTTRNIPIVDIDTIRKHAEQGHAKAQFDLGVCYAKGEGVNKDPAEAAKWYRKAAEQGDAGAQYNLGGCYYNGYGVDKDHAEALKWYRKAAEQGDARAQVALGACYFLGDGIEKDEQQAKHWLREAADGGDPDAKELLQQLERK